METREWNHVDGQLTKIGVQLEKYQNTTLKETEVGNVSMKLDRLHENPSDYQKSFEGLKYKTDLI